MTRRGVAHFIHEIRLIRRRGVARLRVASAANRATFACFAYRNIITFTYHLPLLFAGQGDFSLVLTNCFERTDS
ncbi:MAG: hypothetical protein CMJ58_12025 [Planctomycetaceae bacterium]|nr:hypothetical protein [Planctomycetaceae bacterium]